MIGKQLDGFNVLSPGLLYDAPEGILVIISSDRYAETIAKELDDHGVTNYISFVELEAFGMENENNRDRWVAEKLLRVGKGKKILDAGAGERKYKNIVNIWNI